MKCWQAERFVFTSLRATTRNTDINKAALHSAKKCNVCSARFRSENKLPERGIGKVEFMKRLFKRSLATFLLLRLLQLFIVLGTDASAPLHLLHFYKHS